MSIGRFATDIRLERQPGARQQFTLLRPLIFQRPSGIELTVLEGFRTDGASVPRLLWALFPPFSGPYMAAAVLHDALYAQGVLSRAESDRVFLEAMTATGARLTERWPLYWGVRLGGWVAWRNHRRAQGDRTVLVMAHHATAKK